MIKRALSTATKNLERKSRFKRLNDADLDFFRSVLPQNGAILHKSTGYSADDLLPYNQDWMRKYQGSSLLVLKPRETVQVSNILKYCNQQSIAVVPQGGNTGLVGGAVPVFDEVVINTSAMKEIVKFDATSGILVCQAGCILEVLDQYLGEKGFIMPLDLGAKGSCHIGGNLATNAGGLRLLRYGSLHGSVLGIEAVLADGSVLTDLKMLRKDNTGYDLKQLFIGSEGTLGIITACSILTPPKPKSVNVALLAVESFQKVQQVFTETKVNLAEILSAFEFFDTASLNLVLGHSKQRFPLEADHPFYILIETSGSSKEHDDEKLESFLDKMMTDSLVSDGTVAQDSAQVRNIWSVREGIPEACSKSGAVYKYDISLPLPVLYNLVEDVRTRLTDLNLFKSDGRGPVNSVIGYGHVGDGNLHLNISSKEYSPQVTEAIEPYVYEWTEKHNGSVSAEHGLGFMKRNCMSYSKSPEMVQAMRRIKTVFDPNGILNPYKFLPDTDTT